jgi:hypothetical protein
MVEADIFKFWADVPGDARQHPADVTVLGRTLHHFRLDCLPSPIFGPLRSACVVFLFLSPGFADNDADVIHASSEAGQALYKRQRTGDALLPSEAEFKPAWQWWTRSVRPIGLNLADVRDKVAFLNIAAYKAPPPFKDRHMLAALPSSRVCLSWAQSVLFPQAEQGKTVVVCLRSAAYWGLEPGESHGLLFAPKYTRRGDMHRLPLRDRVVEAVAKAISKPIG